MRIDEGVLRELVQSYRAQTKKCMGLEDVIKELYHEKTKKIRELTELKLKLKAFASQLEYGKSPAWIESENKLFALLEPYVRPRVGNQVKEVSNDIKEEKDAIFNDVMREILYRLRVNDEMEHASAGEILNYCSNVISGNTKNAYRGVRKYSRENAKINNEHEETIGDGLREKDSAIKIAFRKIIDKNLVPQEQVIVYLRYFNGLTIREISEELNMPKSTVSDLLAKAKQKIREVWNHVK